MRFILAICLALGCAAPLAAQGVEDLAAAAGPQVNEIRTRNGLGPLSASAGLAQAAATHASDMQANGFFGHTGSNGSGLGDRARAAGYGFCFIAENISKGQGSLSQVLDSWMGSTGHRRNILSDGAQEFALVRAPGDIWVMVLGRPGC